MMRSADNGIIWPCQRLVSFANSLSSSITIDSPSSRLVPQPQQTDQDPQVAGQDAVAISLAAAMHCRVHPPTADADERKRRAGRTAYHEYLMKICIRCAILMAAYAGSWNSR
jgi:hypothetical protein